MTIPEVLTLVKQDQNVPRRCFGCILECSCPGVLADQFDCDSTNTKYVVKQKEASYGNN